MLSYYKAEANIFLKIKVLYYPPLRWGLMNESIMTVVVEDLKNLDFLQVARIQYVHKWGSH